MVYVHGRSIPTRQVIEELDRLRNTVAQYQQAHMAIKAEKAELETALAKAKARKPSAPRKRRPKPPAPMYGGQTGLMAATKESLDLDNRTAEMIKDGHDSEWIREFKRIRNIK